MLVEKKMDISNVATTSVFQDTALKMATKSVWMEVMKESVNQYFDIFMFVLICLKFEGPLRRYFSPIVLHDGFGSDTTVTIRILKSYHIPY